MVREGLPPSDLMVLALDGDQTETEPLIQTPFSEITADISPDGRWIAYDSDESGQREIYVRPFPNVSGGRFPISSGGGSRPVWSRDGGELFYMRPQGTGVAIMSVRVRAGETWGADPPTTLFEGPYFYNDTPNALGEMRTFDVSPDGQRFLLMKDVTSETDAETPPSQINIVLNWFEELKARVPVP